MPRAGLRSVVTRLRYLFRRDRLDQDLKDEVAFHLAMRERHFSEGRAGGDDDSGRAARRRFGNAAVITEETRDMWTFPSLESFVQDIRYALRSLRRSPGFAVVAIAVLALGIGANSAIFSLVNAVMLRGLPYPQSNRLVLLIGNVQRDTVERRGNSWPDYADWRQQSKSFDRMAAYADFNTTLLSIDEPTRLGAEGVSAEYFSVLGVAPAMGRVFTDEEVAPNGPAVAILSDAAWRTQFGSDPQILGKTATFQSRAFQIIGVMPAGFKGVTDTGEVWLPFPFAWGSLTSRGARGFQAVARLKPGVSRADAQTELNTIASRLAVAYPDTNEKRGVEVADLTAETFATVRGAVTALMAAVAFVLLIACANVATLVMSRAETRAREIAVRAALGAGQARLTRQLVTESAVMVTIGAAAGLALAYAALRLLAVNSPVTLPSFAEPTLDATVVLFTIAITAATALLLGLAPAIHARMAMVADALKSSRGATRASSRLRAGLVVVEVALTVVLLVGAGLMIRSVANLGAVRPGFDATGVLTMDVGLPRLAPVPGATGAAPLAVSIATILDRVRAVPGVQKAALISDVPLTGGGSAVFYAAEGDSTAGAQKAPRAYVHRMSPGFLDALGIPLVEGRTFEPSELVATSTSVIVTENMAHRFWPGQSAVGRRIKIGGAASQNPWSTIVGVVPELKYRGLPANPTADPDIFMPIFDRGQVALVVRGSGTAGTLETPVKAAIRSTASGFVIFNVTSLEQLVATQTAASRFTGWLLSIFAAAALLLAAIGLYGVMAYLVDQRRREFGIRLALGAARSGIVGLVVSNGAALTGIGVLIGAAGAWQMSRLLGTQLFGVSPFDPSAFAAIGLLILIAVAACVVPAVRATRVDPIVVLRNE
jgi:putative ABC transport system permease protein